jgi:predicted signal transduction protein with EAL and GGDEF domain
LSVRPGGRSIKRPTRRSTTDAACGQDEVASLGIATTAEGVETQEQLERVRAEGCTEVQGYLFGPPRPAAELDEIIRAQQPKVSAVA